ncbi:NAD(P)-binding oxidoreductase [Actinocrispum sp. NPDC049592]|uniref:NAD(P)-dependent oxidoreductase n=1 Tax=Actinocrispum sp. NPDC049592 TaxID=3154835 RepID=UPI00342E05FB
MKLTIFAATGGIGRHLLDQALAAGHDVTAVVRNPAKVSADVHTVTGDLATASVDDLTPALAGADAVLSGLGPRSRADAGITALGTQKIIRAMKAADVRRIVVVSAAPVGTFPSPGRPHPPKHDPGDGFWMRHLLSPMISVILRKHYQDLAMMEDSLRDSGLEWTVVRPPQLVDRPLTGDYRTAFDQNLFGGTKISRADVAHLMLAALDRPGTIGRVLGVAY